MADTRENELRKKLQDRNSNVGTKSWLSRNKEDKSDVVRAKEALESVYTEILSHASENITSDERVELQDKYSSKRFITAMQVLNRMEAKGAQPSTPKSAPKKLTQKQVAENYVDVLKNPEKYNLTEKEQEELAEVAWWSTGTADSLHPETINKSEIKNKLETERRFAGDQTKVTESEIESAAYEARKQKIIEHYEALATSEEGRNSSLSLNELYGLELGVRDLTLISPDYLSKLTDTKRAELLTYFKNKYPGIQKLEDAKEKILSSISEKVPMVGGLMMAGQGAQFLANPSGYLASRVVAQAGTRLATNASVQALLTSVAAMTGPVGWLARGVLGIAQLFLGNLLSKYLGGAISGVINGGRKAIAGGAAFLLLAVTTLPASGFAIAGASALIGLALIPIVAFIMFIINSGAYVLPTGTGISTSGDDPVNIDNVSCPLIGGTVLNASYNSVNETGHGSNYYWQSVMGGPYCRFNLPQTANECNGPTNAGNVCSNQASTCPYYGYAADVFPKSSWSVYLPNVNGEALTWNYVRSYDNLNSGTTSLYADTTGRYVIGLTHINAGSITGNNLASGQKIGELFNQGGNTHLHIEFQVDGVYVKPEDWFCNGLGGVVN